MDLKSLAATTVAQFSEAQDNASLRARANQKLAAEAVANPTGVVYGFDAGCMGDGATWCVAAFIDRQPAAPVTPNLTVLVGNARVYTAEALDESSLGLDFFHLQNQIAADLGSGALIACSRITGGGAGGKYLIALLVDANPTPPPPPPP